MTNSEFIIGNKISTEKEIPLRTIDFKEYNLAFKCNKCCTQNSIKIQPYESGINIDNLLKNNQFLKSEFLKYKLVQKPSKGYEYLGELVIWNLPALYIYSNCSNCHNEFITIFGYGEIQPSRESLIISGVWNLIKNS